MWEDMAFSFPLLRLASPVGAIRDGAVVRTPISPPSLCLLSADRPIIYRHFI